MLYRNSKRSLLYRSMVALVIGLEELIESVVFKWPYAGYFAYGLAFLWAPAVLLFLAGILIMIDKDLWKVARIKNKNKSKQPARRYLKAFLATPGIAPTAWLVLSFLQQQYYTCAYFGQLFDSDVMVSNTTDKCRIILGFRSWKLEKSYKARSQITGWSLVLMAVCILFISVCIRRCSKNQKELKMPSLYYYRHKEAEKALKQFHATAKDIVKQSAKENVEKLFQKAAMKEFDACIYRHQRALRSLHRKLSPDLHSFHSAALKQ